MALAVRRHENPARAPQRWDPFQQLEEMVRHLESTWPQEGGDGLAWTPPVDIEETEDAWILEAEVPGVSQKDLNVEVNDNEIVISGDIVERERKGILRRKTRRAGRFDGLTHSEALGPGRCSPPSRPDRGWRGSSAPAP